MNLISEKSIKVESSIGIFGGSFDPIHQGHINIAKAAFKELNLDKLFFMPCKDHPHNKEIMATGHDRLEMLKLGLNDHPYLKIDKRELERPGVSFTFNSLEEIRRKYGNNVKITLLIGSDIFSSLNSWYRYKEILSLTNIAIVKRFGYEDLGAIKDDYLASLLDNSINQIVFNYGQIKILNIPKYKISSSQLRLILKKNTMLNLNVLDDWSDLSSEYICPEVLNYITKKKLYM